MQSENIYDELSKSVTDTKMTLFEVMTGLSVTLAIGLPTFMEKVMRPKYEEQFSEFRKGRREVFVDEFEKALLQLKQAKGEMTQEVIETIESLFSEWGQVKTDENKLTKLLKYRKHLFVGWLVSCVFCLFSIEYSEMMVSQPQNITLGESAMVVFFVMFLVSLWYGVELFALDEKLSKFKTKTTGETFGEVKGINVALESYRRAERKVENALLKFGFPFHKNASFKANGGVIIPDYVISSGKIPKYIIEVKTRIRTRDIYNLSLRYRGIKTDLPLKIILISDFKSSESLAYARSCWDFVVDFRNLDKLKEIIKL